MSQLAQRRDGRGVDQASFCKNKSVEYWYERGQEPATLAISRMIFAPMVLAARGDMNHIAAHGVKSPLRTGPSPDWRLQSASSLVVKWSLSDWGFGMVDGVLGLTGSDWGQTGQTANSHLGWAGRLGWAYAFFKTKQQSRNVAKCARDKVHSHG